MKASLKTALLFFVAAISVHALAKPDFLDVFIDQYHVKDTAKLSDKQCQLCHVSEDGGNSFNPYGADVKKILDANGGKFSWVTIAMAEPLDSNGDGRTNLQKIALDIPPGDPPALKPGETAAAPVAKPLIPRHAFHPAIVHFPIALILVAFMLDMVAVFFKKPVLHKMATYNLWLGTISGFVAIASGFGVMTLKQVPYKGLILTHLSIAIGSIIFAIISLLTRSRSAKAAQVIGIIAIVFAAVMIAVAGHFGGDYVYGE